MSALRYGSMFYPPSNRRRCVKGRPNYTEPSDDILISEPVSHDINSNDSHSQNEYSSVDVMQPEDEELITIDLPAFLHENPWLAHSSCESCVENNVVSPESCSIFRVTVCETKPLEIHKVSWVDEACTADVIKSTVVNSVSNDNLEALAVKKMEKPVIIPTDLWKPEIAKSQSEEGINVLQAKKRVLNAKQNALGHNVERRKSKTRKKKPYESKTYLSNLGSSDTLPVYYNSIINDAIIKGFDDLTESDFQEEKSDSALSTVLMTSEASMKPKGVAEYINEYSKCESKINNSGSNDFTESTFQEEKSDSVSSTILKTSEAAIKPKAVVEYSNEYSKSKIKSNNTGIIDLERSDFKEVKSDSVLNTVMKTSAVSTNSEVIIEYINEYSKRKSKNNNSSFNDLEESDFQKDKSDSVSRTFWIISETSMIPKEDFEYIPEYSKCKSKNNNSGFNDFEESDFQEEKSDSVLITVLITSEDCDQNSIKPKGIDEYNTKYSRSKNKNNKSGFNDLEESDFQEEESDSYLSTLVKISEDSTKSKVFFEYINDYSKCKNKNNNIEFNDLEETDFKEEKSHSVLSTGLKISEVSKKTKVMAEDINEYSKCKSIHNNRRYNDLEESDFKKQMSDSVLSTVSKTSEASINPKVTVEGINEYSKCESKSNYKRKKYAEDTSEISDTLKASECDDDKNSSNVEIDKLSLKLKKLFISSKAVLDAVRTETTSVFSESPKKLDTLPQISVNSSHLTNFKFENKFSSQYCESVSEYNMQITEAVKTCPYEAHLPVFAQKNLMVHSSKPSQCQDVRNVIKSNVSNTMCDESLKKSFNKKSSMLQTYYDDSTTSMYNDLKESYFQEQKSDSVLCTVLKSSQASVKPKVDAEYINEYSRCKYRNNNRGFNEFKESDFQEEKSASVSSTVLMTSESSIKPKVVVVYVIECRKCKSKKIIHGFNELEESDFHEEKNGSVLSTQLNTSEASINEKMIFEYINEYSKCESENNYERKKYAEDSSEISDTSAASECESENYSGNVLKENLSLKQKKLFTPSRGVLEAVSSETTSKFSENPKTLDTPPSIFVNSPYSTNLNFENEYSSEYSASLSDYNMKIVKTDKNCGVEEHLPVSAQKNLMVNSSEASISQDVSKVINSDISNTMCDEYLNESLQEKSSMSHTSIDYFIMNLINDSKELDFLDEKRDSVLSTVLTPSEDFIKPKVVVEDITENSKSRNYNKTNKYAEDSSQTSDTLPASECKDENESANGLKEKFSLKQKTLFTTSRDILEAVISETTSEFSKSPKNLDTPHISDSNSDSTNLNFENEYLPDYSAFFSEYDMEIVDTDKKSHVEEHLPVFAQKNLMVNSSVASVCQDVSSIINSDVSNTMCGEALNKVLNDKSSMLQTSFDDISTNIFNDLEKFDFLDEKRDSVSSTVLTPSEDFIKPKAVVEDITENSKCKSKNNNKRKKYAEDCSQTSDTLPASDRKDENESADGLKEKFSLKQKTLFTTSRDNLEAVISETTSEFSKSPKNLDTPHISDSNSDSTNLNFENEYLPDCSAFFSEYDMEIVDTDKKSHVEEHLPVFAQKNIMANCSLFSVCEVVNDIINSDVSNTMCGESLHECLNDKFCMLLNSFDDISTDIFNDSEKFDLLNEKRDSVLSTVLTPSEDFIKPKVVVEDITENSKSKNYNKRNKYAEDSSQTSDTLSASECKDENESADGLKEKFSLKQKTLFTTSRDILEAVISETTSEFSKSPKNLDTPHISDSNSDSTNLNFVNKYSSDYSAFVSEYNMEIDDTDKKCHGEEHLPMFADKNFRVNFSKASVSQDVNNVIISNVSNRMCGKYLNESLNDKTSMLNTLVEKDESEGLKKDVGKKSDIVPENGTLLKIVKVGETYDENMVIEKTDVIMSESFIESSSEMAKYNHKDIAPECEIALSYFNGKPETDILTPDVNNVHDMNLRESIQITKTIDSKTISEIDINNTSEGNCNNVSSSSVIICENYLDSTEEVSKQEKEIIKVKTGISENISQVNNISLLENVSSPETVKEKNESTFEDHKTNNEELGLISNPENAKEIENLDSEKKQNSTKADLCMKSDDKYENVQSPYSEICHSHKNIISPEKIRLHDNDESGTAEQKKCLESKISFIKNSGDSPDDLKNWFLSETKQTHEVMHSYSDIKVPKTPVDFVTSIIDMHQENALNANSNSVQYLERNFDAVTSDPSVSVDTPVYDTNISLIDDKSLTIHKLTSVETATIIKDDSQLTDTSKTLTKVMPSDSSLSYHSSHNNDMFYKDLADKTTSTFFDDNPLIDLSDSYYNDLPTEKADSLYFESQFFHIDDISDKDMSDEKGNISFPEDNPLAVIDKMLSKDISSKNTCPSSSDDSSLQDKTLTKDTNAKIGLDTFSPVSIKEEQVDEEEDIEKNSILNKLKSELSQKQKTLFTSVKGILEADKTFKRPKTPSHVPPYMCLFRKLLHHMNNILDADLFDEKGNVLFPEDDVSDEINELFSALSSLPDDNSLLDKTPAKYTNAKIMLDTVSPVSIRDPLDEKEYIGRNSSLNNLRSHFKSENSQDVSEAKKKKQGTPHTISVNKISPSNVMLSSALKEACTHETIKSKGQKKKTVLSASSTPSIGTENIYDAELVCVPLSMGWRRLLVIRDTGTDENNKRPSDIYYFAPDGTKLRSMAEIETYLSKYPDIKLTLKNFTFARKLIYREPFEIERDERQQFTNAVKKVDTTRKIALSGYKKFAALNEKIFGKRPVVKCEKQKMENLMKNKKIKVSN